MIEVFSTINTTRKLFYYIRVYASFQQFQFYFVYRLLNGQYLRLYYTLHYRVIVLPSFNFQGLEVFNCFHVYRFRVRNRTRKKPVMISIPSMLSSNGFMYFIFFICLIAERLFNPFQWLLILSLYLYWCYIKFPSSSNSY